MTFLPIYVATNAECAKKGKKLRTKKIQNTLMLAFETNNVVVLNCILFLFLAHCMNVLRQFSKTTLQSSEASFRK